MALEILSISDRDLLQQIWYEFEQYNSGIGYVSCGVAMNDHHYTITTFPDGSMESIIEDVKDSGGLEENLDALGQQYRPVPAIGGTLLMKINWDASEPICYCDRIKLAELWNGLLHLQGHSPVLIHWIEVNEA
ncbi:hypothetical protein NIES2135_66940 (plasmid) [Leptolyngbya boryana NIES-2135]|jgi:hypothetical protein|uniref:Uncharacterized protein n=1 Tax=Leptolyngbya boryana NIES-2135 TaxID=1973484 RepID=A0A1Z4JSY5_LEPBY|nr:MULTISPECIES: hypothetical protein [Leptolyngbya]BAY59817.1 hypothetical protein NIES2135_66940 [Leptolyngbya boryana NIES-2135]MBD2369630.1 hypothetical protein [Leptolyngbya sp. FACHB-161]MBD2375925.1 hypothetical protein [Leptolyngbya sp. FACHB-238]MBD2400201.1 hypothetical protein [Leptolyngbya sp. FACHB-239]MBD2406742.1 hypothetical protein [Leptolyngbya sp. FACHB-402]